MNRFLQTLEESGYRQFYLAFGDANLRYPDWVTGAKGLNGTLLDLVKLLLLQQPLPHKRAAALLGEELLAELVACGVLGEQSGAVTSKSFLLIYCRSYAIFCEITAHPFAYFGEDTIALAAYQTPAPGGRVLDLCCGPGTQSFVAASFAAEVTGVEIRKETWRIAELNRRLNRLDQLEPRVKFVCNSAAGFAKAGSEKYDRILFNPPLVPMVPGYEGPFVGDGGAGGLDVTRDILEHYHRRIADGGSIEFIGMDLGQKGRPGCEHVRALARRYGLGGRIHIFSQHPLRPSSPMFEGLAFGMARDNGLNITEARNLLEKHFAKFGANITWQFFASLNRAPGARSKELTVVDVSKSFLGHWFV